MPKAAARPDAPATRGDLDLDLDLDLERDADRYRQERLHGLPAMKVVGQGTAVKTPQDAAQDALKAPGLLEPKG